jgi:hypothetical protein
LPKYYYRPILEKVKETYLANAQVEYETNVDIEADVVLFIEAASEDEANSAKIGFIDIRMWELYQTEE